MVKKGYILLLLVALIEGRRLANQTTLQTDMRLEAKKVGILLMMHWTAPTQRHPNVASWLGTVLTAPDKQRLLLPQQQTFLRVSQHFRSSPNGRHRNRGVLSQDTLGLPVFSFLAQ